MKQFSAPIPGESLTKPQGGAGYEQPPQFTDAFEASDHVMDIVTKRDKAPKLEALIRSGAPLEAITRSIIFKGFVDGKWSVDTGMLMAKPVMAGIGAFAKRKGISDKEIVMWNNRTSNDRYFSQFVDLAKETKPELPVDEGVLQEPVKKEPKGLLGKL